MFKDVKKIFTKHQWDIKKTSNNTMKFQRMSSRTRKTLRDVWQCCENFGGCWENLKS
jgi:hypothetical protein